MLSIIAGVGVLVALLGLAIFVSPPLLKRILVFYEEGSRLYAALVFRVIFGTLLIAAADQSRSPKVVLTLGVITVIAGLGGFFVGLDRMRALARWWSRQSPLTVRAWSLVAIVFGAFLVYVSL